MSEENCIPYHYPFGLGVQFSLLSTSLIESGPPDAVPFESHSGSLRSQPCL